MAVSMARRRAPWSIAARALSCLLAWLGCGLRANAQNQTWLRGDGLPGLDGPVYALTTWDPDGPGPMPTALVAGGDFEIAGTAEASGIARWDGSTWFPLGNGVDGYVEALAVMPNGDLVAGGFFTCASGVSANAVARWDGTSWSSLGSGVTFFGDRGSVKALAVLHNGDLVAGGYFTVAGEVSTGFIARWDGVSWSPFGPGVNGSGPGMNSNVECLAVLPNGDLVAGGQFTHADGGLVNRVARWDGASWSALGSGIEGEFVRVSALTVLQSGDVVAGGGFAAAGGGLADNIARWDGVAWSPLGSGLGSRVHALTVLPNGDLVAGGYFGQGVARWDGASWSSLGSGVNTSVWALATLSGGDLVAGGYFMTAGGEAANHVAQWSNSSWSALGSGLNLSVSALITLPDGDVVAGGGFTSAGGAPASRIARWDGSAWSPLGSGMNNWVHALAVLPNGDLVAGGEFSSAGGQSAARRVARWNGSSWSSLGFGFFSGQVDALAVMPNGDLVAGGLFLVAGVFDTLARWDGASWLPINAEMDGSVKCLAVLPNGDLIAGGSFTAAGGVQVNGVARWNGSSWSSLDSGVSGGSSTVYALALLPNGDLVAGGWFTHAGGAMANNIARWDGDEWFPLGSGVNIQVSALAVLPDGDLMVGGLFSSAGGAPANNVAQWDGSSWSPLGPGVTGGYLGGTPHVSAFALTPEGEVTVGGNFTTAGGYVSPFFARWGASPFAAPELIPAGDSPAAVAAANFDGDMLTRLDLAVANAGSNTVTLLFNTGVPGSTATFSAPSPSFTFPTGDEPRSIVGADFTGDGVPDLAVACAASNSLSILIGQSGGTFTGAASVPTGARPVSLAASDLDHDGLPELVVACRNAGVAQVFRNIGGGQFAIAAILQHGLAADPTGVGSGDLEGDKEEDIVVTDGTAGVVAVFRNLGGFLFEAAQVYSVADICGGADPRSILLRDIDSDGQLDVVTANRGDNSVSVLRNLGASVGGQWLGLAAPVTSPVGHLPTCVTGDDFYGDGNTDLVTANAFNDPEGSISVLRNTSVPGAISFAEEIRQSVPPDAGFIISADINGDEHPDVVLANSVLAGGQQLLDERWNGGLRSQGSRAVGGSATALLNAIQEQPHIPCAGDANGDRSCDFIDLNIVLGAFGQAAPALPGDLNADGVVDFLDLNIVLGAYGSSC